MPEAEELFDLKILVTGASGYIGSSLTKALKSVDHIFVRALDRSPSAPSSRADQNYSVDLSSLSDLSGVVHGIDVIIHAAARVHVVQEKSSNPLREFRRINTEATLALAEAAAQSGVKRFVFLSTIGVTGRVDVGESVDESSILTPDTPYSISKAEAEIGLLEIACETGMEVVIIRPPMVYGPGCPGNLCRLISLVQKLPILPFGSLTAVRSMIYIDNLVSALLAVIEHPDAANQVFVVADNEEFSVTQLVQFLSHQLSHRCFLLPVPLWMLKVTGLIIGKSREIESLTSSLRVDSNKIRTLLDWSPVCSVTKGLHATVNSFK